jgi:hypothetical protein
MKDIALLVGNGVNSISHGLTWEELLNNIVDHCNCKELNDDKKKPFPLFYEEIFQTGIKNGSISDETTLKKFIAEQVSLIESNEIHKLIRKIKPVHIITTNYEFLLEGEVPKKNNGIVNESKYSIFRRYELADITYWHLHGDGLDPRSINLGYEHYSGQLQKMRNYVTSVTDYKTNQLLKLPLARRLKERHTSEVVQSWIDLFFLKDVHIIGLTLDFVESDLWWLLTYRARIKNYERLFNISNTITYYIPSEYYDEQDFKIRLLRAAEVKVKPIDLPHDAAYYKKVLMDL